MNTLSHILERTLKACWRLLGCGLVLAAAATAATAATDRGALTYVPESTNYSLVYLLNIPESPNYAEGVTYDIDLHAYTPEFDRVAYFFELRPNTQIGFVDYVWVSMDAFTTNVTRIGVPTLASGADFQQPVTNMNVRSSYSSIVWGTNLSGGNLEFWPYNYDPANATGVTNASDTLMDWGDHQQTSGNYGSMQVHNAAASQVLFAFNRWGGYGGAADVGMGNGPAGTSPDWTFDQNAANYNVRTLSVYVRPVRDTNPPVLVKALGSGGLTNVLLTFSKVLDLGATNVANYALDGGVSVLGATLDSLTKLKVTLTTTPQKPLTSYLVTVNGVTDGTTNHYPIAPNSSVSFVSSLASLTATSNVPEAALYTPIYGLNIPTAPDYSTGVVYGLDQRADVADFSRIAYYVVLQRSGELPNYLWVSMDAFTHDVNRIGVPTVGSGAFFQQPVTNMTVFSGDTNIVTGTNLAGGHLEFWPTGYDPFNSAAVPHASSAVYDWGDHPIPGNYGSMQIHNADASQVLFAFNRWGGFGGTADLGIGNDPAGSDPDWTFAQNAGSYTVKFLEVFVLPIVDTNSPTILSAVASNNFTNVTVTFSRPVDDDATNTADYVLTGGLTVLGAALDSATKTAVTLTTSAQQPFTAYTLTVNGVKDRNGSHTPMAANATIAFTSPPVRGLLNNVPEAAAYALVYSLDIPNSPNYAGGVIYDIDLHRYVGDYSRVAYYLEIEATNGPLNFLWVSMDAFATNPASIGVPTFGSGAVFQQPVTNLNVLSSVAGIVKGSRLAGGRLEFWPYNYDPANSAGVTNASDLAYDWGDHPQGYGNFGSMQVHNAEASQVLFAFNRWGGYGGIADLGIGNGPAGASPDWTFAQNASSYAVKSLQVLVLPVSNTNPPVLVGAVGQFGLTNVVLTFSKALDDGATNTAHYAIDGGVKVLGATLDPLTKVTVTLTTTNQAPATSYTVTMNGLTDRTVNHLALPTNATAAFRSSVAARGASVNVAEIVDYTGVYSLDIPDVPNYASSLTYTIDERGQAGRFSRIAYYLELEAKGGPLNYLWVSMDAFTTNVSQIGVPTVASGAFFQQPVANMTVVSSDPAIVAGTNLAGGNIEFWPTDYEPLNSAAVPGASDGVYDWGDHPISGKYGSMQVHNAEARQVLFAFNNWGGNGMVADLGIGNDPTGVNPDWTSAGNASRYTVKRLQVYVKREATLPTLTGGFIAAGQFRISWDAQSGTSYSILRTLALDGGSWTKVGGVLATTNTAEFIDLGATNRASYYQISTP